MLEDITFAIPTYNRNDYLKQLLNSIPDNQGFKFAISDNGGFVLKETLTKHANQITIKSCKEVIQMYDNWNLAISLVETKWFFIPSDDDLYYPEQIIKVSDALKKYGDADIIIFGHHVIDENDKILSSWLPDVEGEFEKGQGFEQFKFGVDARFPAILFRTSFVKKMGLIDSTYLFTAGDSLLIQKCLIYGKSVFIKQIIGAYRTWPNNFTNERIASKEWLEKIDRWQNELAIEIEKSGVLVYEKKRIGDEVYARNLIGGLSSLKRNKGMLYAFRFLMQNRYPWFALLKTQARIFYTLVFS